MASVKSIAEVFLDDRFPQWKEDNTTYMIPPIFEATKSRHQIGIVQSVPYTDSGDDGESIIYELLRMLGEKEKMGMFVLNGFNLQHIKKWEGVCKSYSVPELPCYDGECDFIIFHHRLGLIFIEVKTISKEDECKEDKDGQNNRMKNAKKKKSKRQKHAKGQLERSLESMQIFSEPREGVLSNEETRDDSPKSLYTFSIPCKKVVALPSTKKVDFNRQNLSDDKLRLLEDDCQDLSSFQKWWNQTIERNVEMPAETQNAYKRALSTVLMIRHLCPVTETEGIEEIHKSLVTFQFHDTKKRKPFPQLMEDEFPFLWRWCQDILDRKIKRDPALRKDEKKLQELFMNEHKLNEQDLREGKGMTLLNTLLKNQKYIEGDKYSEMDDAISAVFEDHYCLFYKNILRYTNMMKEMVPNIKEEEVFPDINEQQVVPKIKQREVLQETKNQELLPDIKGLALLDTTNQEVLPEIKHQKVLPEVKDQEVLPEIEDQKVLPEIKDEEVLPEIKDEKVLPEIKDEKVLPEIKDQEVLSEIKDQEVLLEIKDREALQEIKNQEVLPQFNEREVLPKLHEMLPFTKLESARDFNLLDRHLGKSLFIQQGQASIFDQQLYKELLHKMKFVRTHQPHPSILLTLEQLVVFEGPEKQLIIGPPGSGKTELLKFKALKQNDIEKNSGTNGKKIMYILANGSSHYPARNSLFFHDIKEFFKDAPLVEVISIVLAEESAKDTEQTTSAIREKIQSGEYEHAFIDEYWIGSKPVEHKIILELVRGLPGYVWISSVFDYDQKLIKYNEWMIQRTQPLLTALNEKMGKVQRITQVMRGTNSIIELERDYSRLYGKRSYPYGTEEILGHSYVGLPVTWVVEESVDRMYEQCVDIVKRAIKNGFPEGVAKRDILTIKPNDIVVVDFAIRTEESRQLEKSLPSRLTNNDISVWTFGENHADTVEKVAVLQSDKRSASEFLDGVERKMVVVILPSGMVLKTAKVADGATALRNYDTYISFFRTMVKLVVISDKWENKETFLADISTNV